MPHSSLQELYQWARSHLDQPIMLGYLLYKVNGQVPGHILILLKQPTSERPNAEIEVESVVEDDGTRIYKAYFHYLPYNTTFPRPGQLRETMTTQRQVISWIKLGYRQLNEE